MEKLDRSMPASSEQCVRSPIPTHSGTAMEAFVQRVDGGRYQAGYRLAETQEVIASIEIAAETLDRTVASGLLFSIRITPDGNVVANLDARESFATNADFPNLVIPIDRLVSETVDSENLRLEEADVTELNTLLSRLEYSVSIVKAALVRLRSPN